MKTHNHIFRGKRFKVIFRAPKNRNHIGLCNYETKEIELHPKIDGIDKLDCIIHEALHVCMPDILDDVIDESATDIAKLLWKLNYRDQGDKNEIVKSKASKRSRV